MEDFLSMSMEATFAARILEVLPPTFLQVEGADPVVVSVARSPAPLDSTHFHTMVFG